MARRDRLLAVDELTKHFPPNPLGQQRGDAKETTMVLYFGDVWTNGWRRVGWRDHADAVVPAQVLY